MTDNAVHIIELLALTCTGLALGCVYYGGLWFTVSRVAHWRQPALAMLASLMIRLSVLAIGLYLVAGSDWQRYLAALPGLLLARWWWVRRIKLKEVA